MPELPEVETVRRGLMKVLPGLQISNIQIRNEKSFRGNAEDLLESHVLDIGRRGKMLMIHLEKDQTILVHLRMTGQLIHVHNNGERDGGGHPTDELLGELPNKHSHVIIHFSSGATMFFNDQRKFGYLQVHPTSKLKEESFLSKLGPEPWSDEFDVDYLWTLVKKRKTSIKAILLNQHIVAGIGNIYADEALFLSGIMPDSICSKVPKQKLEALIQFSQEVLERGIEFGGVSARDYVNAEGLRGTMQKQLYVYGREGQPCKQCQGTIEKCIVATRGTHICQHCQKKFG